MRRFGCPSSAALAAVFVCVLAPTRATADTISLAWDASRDSNVAGYLMYVQVSSGLSKDFDVGPQVRFDFTEAQPGIQYCFSVASYYAQEDGTSVIGSRTGQVCGYSNAPPILAAPSNQTTTVGQSASLQLSGSDPEGQAVTYSVTGLPPGLSMVGSTGFISGTPTTAGTYQVTATVHDGVLSTDRMFTWTVVTPDTTVPSIAITQPTSSSAFSASIVTLTLAGWASDNVGVTQVTWVNDRGGSGTASGRTSWSMTVTLASGTNNITVTARDAAGNVGTDRLAVSYVGPLVLTALTANRVAPQPAGTSITFTATIAGGTAPQQYKWWVYDGSSWTVTREWSTSNTWTWAPTTANSAYQVAVWVRNSTSTADAPDNSNAVGIIAFPITAATSSSSSSTGTATTQSGALALTALLADRPSPQPAGSSITFTASATGGVTPYQFKWWVQSGGVWSVAREWSSSATFTWQPSSAGTYMVAVWGRNAGVTADASQAMAQLSYVISNPVSSGVSTSGASLVITSLTSDRLSPQIAGSTITFTAGAAGGTAPYQFKWWVQIGGVWSVAREWSSTATLSWRPTTAGSYVVAVWARNAGVTVDASQALAQVSYVISPGTSGSTAPLSVTGLWSSVSGPQRVGTTIGFTASASGGTAPYQFKWWVYDGIEWSVAQNWSSSASLSWRPTRAGTYIVAVWARSAGVTADAAQAFQQVTYVISP